MNGMDDNEDEHNFSDDDDFGNLADDALQELEHNAILSTQQPQQAAPVQRQASNTSRQSIVPLNASRANILPHLQDALNESFDHDSFETLGEERVPTPVEEARSFIPQQHRPPGEVSQKEQWRVNRFGKPNPNPQYRPQKPPRQPARNDHTGAGAVLSQRDPNNLSRTFGGTQGTTGPDSESSKAPDNGDGDALSARIAELLKERDVLFTDLKQAKDDLMTQKGEIAIIRENKDKETKVFDRQLAAMKKSMQDEAIKHQTALDSLSSKHGALTTEFNMTKDDLKEETRRNKSLQARLKDRPGEKAGDRTASPQKQISANSLRDGFDDDEMMAVSPVKSASRRSKNNTPTAANRRKRKVDSSPIKPLVLRQSDEVVTDDAVKHEPGKKLDRVVPVFRKDKQAERHLKLLQRVFDYQLKASGERLIEALVRFALPSELNVSISSIVLDSLARLSGPKLPTDLLQTFIDLWSRSLKEKYYDCIPVLLEIVDYILDIQTTIVEKDIISTLLVVLQDSATINGSARFKHSPVYRGNQGQFRQTPISALNSSVDSTACLGMLYKVACLSVDSEPLIDHFWRSMETDFVLMMLNSWQPISDITRMLHLLATSIFESTFGNICADPSTQNTMETHIINRVSYLLWETPKVDEGLPNPSRADLCRFRLEAFELLSTLAIDSSLPPHNDPHHHGSVLLASHPSAIARIVRSLYDATASLYLLTSTSALHAQIVNRGVRLLYHLMMQHGEEVDLQQKLSAVNGGVHKHRVVLTRLAFSEGSFVDAEVTDETCAMATALLEDSVTPDEAEMMIQAFPGFNGRKKDNAASSLREEDSMDVEA